jgi:hypothetical protein
MQEIWTDWTNCFHSQLQIYIPAPLYTAPSSYFLLLIARVAHPVLCDTTLLTDHGPLPWSSGQSSWLQNGDILCFLWGTNWIYIYIYYVEESRPPLWSSGQSSWLQIQRFGFDSRRYKIFWEALSLERGPLSLVSTIEELLGRNSNSSVLENGEYGRGDQLPWPRDTLYPQNLELTSPTSCRSFGLVRLQTKTTEFCFS